MKKGRSHCPINFSLEIFGDKWTLLIIRDLIFLKKRTYGELKNSPEGIATNILADRLSLLENEGIIIKQLDPTNGKVYLYTLTQKGIDVLPVILEMCLWGAHYGAETTAPAHLIKLIKNDRNMAIKEIIAAMKHPRDTIFNKSNRNAL